MREPSAAILADVVRLRAEQSPDFDVVTFEHASLDGGATPDERRSYAQLAERANRIAAALLARNVARGDRFALMMRNHPEFVETMIAASITGAVFVPIDPRTRRDKLAFLLRDSGCRGAICADYALAELLAAQERGPALEWILALDTGEEAGSMRGADALGVGTLAEVLDRPAETIDSRLESANDPLQILFTSGTTGDPKGVVWPNARFGAFAGLGALLGYRPDERPYTGLSLTHGNAQAVTLGPSLALGLHCVLSRRFTKSKLWDVCRHHGCTTFSMLGGMATAIYGEPPRADDADHPVRFVVSAGMPVTLWEAFEKRFGVGIFEWYGAVEGGLAMKPIGQGPIGSFGRPLPGLEMKILDDQDRECPPGVQGEICSRPTGGRAEVEYHGNPEASAANKGGGIRRNGDFVNPGFVEKVLAEHHAVSDVFVYGVPSASGAPGEKDVVAAIVAAPDTRWDRGVSASVFEHCRKGLEPNFVPSFLQVVDEIPKTASEKPQERFLLERFAPDAPGVFREERPPR
ncbi:MAG: AMP-binding protein [Myxococcota bacterium]|nr:AMP-binding protein [Myxococcota bacterium]